MGLNLARAVCLIGRWRSRSLFVADPLTPRRVQLQKLLKEVEAAARQRQAEAYRTFGAQIEVSGKTQRARRRRERGGAERGGAERGGAERGAADWF